MCKDHARWGRSEVGTHPDVRGFFCFSVSNELELIIKYPTAVPNCYDHAEKILDLFFISNHQNYIYTVPSPLGSYDHCPFSVSSSFTESIHHHLSPLTHGHLWHFDMCDFLLDFSRNNYCFHMWILSS